MPRIYRETFRETSGAISRDTLLHNLRAGEILPPARTNEQELVLIQSNPPPPSGPSTINAQLSAN